jgi:hypothetical protein
VGSFYNRTTPGGILLDVLTLERNNTLHARPYLQGACFLRDNKEAEK